MVMIVGWSVVALGCTYYLIVSLWYEKLLRSQFPEHGVDIGSGRVRYFHPLQMGRWKLDEFTEEEREFLNTARRATGPAINLVWAGAVLIVLGAFLPF